MKTVLFFYLIMLGVVQKTRQSYSATSTRDCKMTRAGREYAGPLSITQSGLTCQPWNSIQPHDHRFRDSTLFPEGGAEAAGNKCRNPDSKYSEGVWCYTTDPNRRWDVCDVPYCNCKLTEAGHEYAGPLNVTRSGRTCQRWNSIQPHYHNNRESTLFPECNAEAAGNKCRNPKKGYNEGVWCYTTDPNTRWELCDVPLCNCKLTEAGREYAGPLSITRSGRTCQRWNSSYPHEHRFRESTDFPEGGAEAAGNKCRNPDNDYHAGVWCYTTDPDRRREACDVPSCY